MAVRRKLSIFPVFRQVWPHFCSGSKLYRRYKSKFKPSREKQNKNIADKCFDRESSALPVCLILRVTCLTPVNCIRFSTFACASRDVCLSFNGMSPMSLNAWWLGRKCSEIEAGLEEEVGLFKGRRCSLKRSLSLRLVSHIYCFCSVGSVL